jgi:hypothetical protein
MSTFSTQKRVYKKPTDEGENAKTFSSPLSQSLLPSFPLSVETAKLSAFGCCYWSAGGGGSGGGGGGGVTVGKASRAPWLDESPGNGGGHISWTTKTFSRHERLVNLFV